MKYILPAIVLFALLTGCEKQNETVISEVPELSDADNSSSPELDAKLQELSALMKKGGAQDAKLNDEDKKKIETLLQLVLPDQDFIGSGRSWDVTYNDMEQGDFFQVHLRDKRETNSNGLMWFHILYTQEKPSFYGSEDFGKYRGMGSEDVHYFIMVGNVEIRAVASGEEYKDDSKIKGMLNAFKLEDIEGL